MGQDALTTNQLQVILTGVVGDGCFTPPVDKIQKYHKYLTNCIHKEYLEYKAFLLGELASPIYSSMNKGYKKSVIYKLYAKSHPDITRIATNSLKINLNLLDDLGLALWFYDDGSLHKNSYCYNLCTHAFSKSDHENIIIPFLEERLNIKVALAREVKKDGREFYYCRINKLAGAYVISRLLSKYPVECYKYKIFPDRVTDEKFVERTTKLQLTPEQRAVRNTLRQYPDERILGNGALTGDSGIIFNTRTIKALERKGITVNGKLMQPFNKSNV